MTWTTNSIRDEEEKIMYAYEFVRAYCEWHDVEAKEPEVKMDKDGGMFVGIDLCYKGERIHWLCAYVDTFTVERNLVIELLSDTFRVVAKLNHWQW